MVTRDFQLSLKGLEEGELNLERVDAVVQTALNRKMLAKAALHFQRNGVMLRSMSELLREIVTIFDAIIDQQGAEAVETTEEATSILQSMFKASLNPGDKYLKSFLRNLNEENGRVEADEMKFNSIPKGRGRPPKWNESDNEQLRKVAEATLASPKIQKLLEDIRNGKKE